MKSEPQAKCEMVLGLCKDLFNMGIGDGPKVMGSQLNPQTALRLIDIMSLLGEELEEGLNLMMESLGIDRVEVRNEDGWIVHTIDPEGRGFIDDPIAKDKA